MTIASAVIARRLGLIRAQTTDIGHERDLSVPMDDGVVLCADRWVARGRAPSAQPTVLVRSPYGRRGVVGLLYGRLLAERGLQVVVQSVRGTFGSGGRFTPFDERADGGATLRWLRVQPWHAGPVATIGPSYLGFVQWALAAGDDPARPELAALAVAVTASQFYDQTYAGGSVALETVASWLAIVALQEHWLAPVAIARGLRTLRGLLAEHPLIGLDELLTGAPVPWLREGFEHPGREDDYWRRRDFSPDVAGVRAPVSFVAGLYDFLLPWMLEDYAALQAAPLVEPPRLILGPWTHTSPQLAAVAHRDGIAWLRAHLLGDRRLLAAEGRPTPVRVFVTGADGGWRDLASWPPPARPMELHLRDGGVLAAGGQALEAGDTNGRAAGDRYLYDPADPTPALGGPVLLSREPVRDNAPLEAREDVLVYTAAALAAPLEAIGRPQVSLWIRASGPFFDVFARLCEVDERGVSRNVSDGLVSVRPESHPRSADGCREVTVGLWPMAHRFAAGHRLRLLVASGAHPRFARNPGTGADPSGASPRAMRPVRIEVLRDAEHPSRLTLPQTSGGGVGDAD